LQHRGSKALTGAGVNASTKPAFAEDQPHAREPLHRIRASRAAATGKSS